MDGIPFVSVVVIRKRGNQSMEQKICCRKCDLLLPESKFYYSNKTGKFNECKDCLDYRIDPQNYQEIRQLCEEIDVPFFSDIWEQEVNRTLEHFGKVTCKSVLGKYLAKMKLCSFHQMRYKDSPILKEG